MRIWAFGLAGERSYVATVDLNENRIISLYDLDNGKELNLKKDDQKRDFSEFENYFENPLEFYKNNSRLSVQHTFVVEKISAGKYQWALREYQEKKSEEYFKLVKVFVSSSEAPLKFEWKIPRDE